jgi:EmrB/QacA subfamily drug resistance transporter
MSGDGDVRVSRKSWITLVGMTVALSMILVDQTAVPLAVPHVIADLGGSLSESQWVLTANVLPLAAFMVLGGRLGDLLGLRRIFVVGAVVFGVSTVFAGLAQDMPWMIAARAVQGTGAALMMPTAVAIVSAVFPSDRRGSALGILAGASAFFAALGPVLGGLLTSVDWRLVFLINVPLAITAVVLTVYAMPRLDPDPSAERRIDFPGVVTFALGIGAIVFGLSQGQADGWDKADTVIPLVVGAVSLAVFTVIELRVEVPLLRFRLFRHLNFLAANISQVLAGAIELGLGFLLPIYLLLVVGISPEAAGIALIPATLPIILAGPLAGRAFDRVGGRAPLAIGFGVLVASGIALGIAVPERDVPALIPGLVLQGIGLGIVLTTNDPTGLTAVPEKDRGEAAGMINTTEQLGGALGIAALTAIEVGRARELTIQKLADKGITPSQEQVEKFKEFLLHAEQSGIRKAHAAKDIQIAIGDSIAAHVDAFQLMFYVSAGIALVGAVACLILVRRGDRLAEGPIFARRSRWAYVTSGHGPGITKRPRPGTGASRARP